MSVAEEAAQKRPPTVAAEPAENPATSRSAVDRLIADALTEMGEPSLSIRELERRAGLPQGALSTTLKPSQRGKQVSIAVQERFARALNLDITTVSRAFAADSPLGDPAKLTPRQRQAADLLAKMPESFQDSALEHLAALVKLARVTSKLAADTPPAAEEPTPGHASAADLH
jgi:hypothetical protein